jgi:hypothetical protein
MLVSLLLFTIPVYAEDGLMCNWFKIGCSESSDLYADSSLAPEKLITADSVDIVSRDGQTTLELKSLDTKKVNDVKAEDIYLSRNVVAFPSEKYSKETYFKQETRTEIELVPVYADKETIDINGSVTRELIGYDEIVKEIPLPIATINFGDCRPNKAYAVYKHPDFVTDKQTIIREGELQSVIGCQVIETISTPYEYYDEELDKVVSGVSERHVYGLVYDVYEFSSYAVNPTELLDGLISYYKLDETSGTNANDSVGNFNGTTSGSIVWNSSGKINGAIQFNANTQYIGINNAVTNRNELTYCSWINPSTLTTGRVIFGDRNSGGTNELRLHVQNTNKISWWGFWSSAYQFQIESTTTFSTDTWYYVCGVYSVNDARLYVNGVQEGSTDTSVVSRSNDTLNPRIGHWHGTDSQYQFLGRIDEVAIYNRSLSADEVSTLYELGLNGIQYPFQIAVVQAKETFTNNSLRFFTSLNISNILYNFMSKEDGLTYSDEWDNPAFDSFGNNSGTMENFVTNDGTVSGGVTIEDGAMKFDGVDGKVALNNKITLDTKFTIGFWANTNSNSPSLSAFINRYQTTTNQRSYHIGVNSHKYRLLLSQDGVNSYSHHSTNNINYGNWEFIVYTSDGTKTKIYRNGVFDSEQILTITGIFDSTAETQIGKGWVQYLHGSLDGVLIFNRSLSQDEITLLYNQGRGSYSPFTNGLVAQYSGKDYEGTPNAPTTILDTNYVVSNDRDSTAMRFNTTTYVEFPSLGSPLGVAYWYNEGAGWNHILKNVDDSYYLNGVSSTSQTIYANATTIGYNFNGSMDDVRYFNRTLSSTEAFDLYNNSLSTAGIDSLVAHYPLQAPSYTKLLQNNLVVDEVTVASNNYFPYSEEDYNLSNLLEAELYSNEVTFRAFEKVTGTEITTFNVSINGTLMNSTMDIQLPQGNFSVEFSKAGYFNQTQEIEVLFGGQTEFNFTDVFNSQVNLTLATIATTENITSYNITVSNPTYSFTEQFTGDGNISNSTLMNLTQGVQYNITVDATGFKQQSELIIVNAMNQNETITLTQSGITNATFIIKNEKTGALLNQNATMVIDRFTSSESYTIVNGNSSFLVPEFDSNIRFVASSTGYSTRTVVVDFTGQRTDEYELTLGLLNTSDVTTETVRFVITNTASIAIQDAIVKIERATPDGLVLVEQKNTDISGVAQVVLDTEPQYFITITKDRFITKSFFLEITSNEYLIVLQPTFDIQYSSGFEGVFFTLFPTEGSTLPPNVTTFTLTSTAINNNLQLARISLFNRTNLLTPKITNTSSNSSGTSVTITYDLSEFLDQNFYIRVYHTVGGATNFITYQYHVQATVSAEGTIQDLRTWAIANFSLNTRVMLLVFLTLLTMVLLAVFPIRANDNIMITLILSVFYSWSLGISLLIIAPIYTVLFIVVYASRGGN